MNQLKVKLTLDSFLIAVCVTCLSPAFLLLQGNVGETFFRAEGVYEYLFFWLNASPGESGT